MSSYAAFSHLGFAAAVAGFSVVLITAMLVAVFLHDVVIRDSSPLPAKSMFPSMRIGGLAVAGAFLVGISLVQLFGDDVPIKAGYFWGFLAALLVIAAVTLYGTFKSLDIKAKISGQIVAAALVMGAGVVIGDLHLPWFGWIVGGWWVYPLTLGWILGLTNAYNAMAGLDDLATSTAVIASAFFGYISLQQDSAFIYLCSVALFSASLGFLIFNRLAAKCPLGDIGSIFLGFSFAVMAIIAGRYDRSHTSILVIPLLLFHFIFDVVFTHVRVLWSAKAMPNGQRDYLYQLLGKSGYSDRMILLIHSSMATAQGFGAIALVNTSESGRLWVFLPFLLFQSMYAYWVIRLAKRRAMK